MNRSIMIVICDFLVLCALSLSSGLNELQNTVNPNIPGFPDNTVTVSEAKSVTLDEYQRVLQEAAKFKDELARLGGVDAKNRSIAVELEESRSKLSESERKMGELSAKLFQNEQELKQAAASLIQARKQAAEKTEKLKQAGQRVEDLSAAMEASRKRAETLEKMSAFQMEQFKDTRKQLKRSSAMVDRQRNEIRKQEKDLSSASVRIGTLETELKGRDRDLNSMRFALEKARKKMEQDEKDLAYIRGRLQKKSLESEHLQRQLADAETKLRSTSLEKYSTSVVQLCFSVTNQRPVIGENVFSSVQYLPEVQIQGKIYLPAALLPATGLDRNFSGFTRITALRYEVLPASGKGKGSTITESLLVPDALPGVCLIPVKQISASPLKILDRNRLKKRGLRNLTLFKAGSPGKATAELAERCSFNDLEGGTALLIRNSLRRGSELAAEPGDFIISKEGEFVGVVTGVSGEKNGYRLAKCTLFPPVLSLNGKKLNLMKSAGDSGYQLFAETAEALRLQMEKNDPEYR